MRIAVIGVGSIGKALATLFARHNHEVFLGSRRADATEFARGIGATGGLKYREAAQRAEAICFCVSWEHSEAVIAELGDLHERLLIDVSNPETPDGRSLAAGHSISGAELLASRIPSARVVKAFNYIYAELLLDTAALAHLRPSIFYCGDDATAKADTSSLIVSCGLEPIDCGPLANARYLEPLAMLVVQLVREQGWAPAGIAMRLQHL